MGKATYVCEGIGGLLFWAPYLAKKPAFQSSTALTTHLSARES
jgi:hypothetical protein